MADALGTQTQAASFEEAAATYDSEFADTMAGVWLRESVWSRLAPFVKPGMHALDLGCGTGEDSLWLARRACRVTAADGSPAMLEKIGAKAARLNLAHRVRTMCLDLNAPAESEPPAGHPFDLVLSNFGAINCVGDLSTLGPKLKAWLKPGGVAALVFMGRFCAWESAYYLARFDARAVRRWRGRARATVGTQGVDVRYGRPREVLSALGPSFRSVAVHGIGTFVPPSYLFHWVEQHPRSFRALATCERRTAHLWPLSRIGDHTLVIARRLVVVGPAGGSR
jgi:ubiquinone/menaquinone biosynthesis C-methylase UbiE